MGHSVGHSRYRRERVVVLETTKSSRGLEALSPMVVLRSELKIEGESA